MTSIDRRDRPRDVAFCRRTPAAIRHLRDEFETRLDAREDLGAFVDGVGELAVSTAPPQPRGSTTASVAVAPPDETLSRLESLYRDYFMDGDADGAVAAHMAGTLGEDVAAAVRTRSSFDPVLRTVLLRSTRELVRERERCLSLLSRELAGLERAWTRLAAIDRSLAGMASTPLAPLGFEALAALDRRLGRLERRAERLHGHRQRQRRDHPGDGGPGVTPGRFYAAVYAPLEGPAPVLADCAVLLDRLASARRGVRRALVTRA